MDCRAVTTLGSRSVLSNYVIGLRNPECGIVPTLCRVKRIYIAGGGAWRGILIPSPFTFDGDVRTMSKTRVKAGLTGHTVPGRRIPGHWANPGPGGAARWPRPNRLPRGYGAGLERTSSKTKGTATSPHSGPALVGSQYFDLWHLKNVKTKFRKKI